MSIFLTTSRTTLASGGQRAGSAMTDEPPLEGENTFEGDVKNDATPQGGVNPNQRGRTNK
jgi:hypothetical protein